MEYVSSSIFDELPTFETGGVPGEKILLVDGDIIAYRSATAAEKRLYVVGDSATFTYKKEAVAYCTEKGIDQDQITFTYNTEDVTHALHNVKTTMNTIHAGVEGVGETRVYLTGESNFRNDVFPEYKMHREDNRKPSHLDACREYLIRYHGAIVSVGCEADDLLAIEAHKDLENSIIATLDKDLNMVPCGHLNWVKDGLYHTTREQGMEIFYRQLLTGDRVDNIPGLPGVGPVRALKLIPEDSGMSEWDMYHTVLVEYIKQGIPKGQGDSLGQDRGYVTAKILEVSRNARLLWLQTKEGELWQPPCRIGEVVSA